MQGSLADRVYLGLLLNTPRTSSAGMERCLGRLFRRIMTDEDGVGRGRSEEETDDPSSTEEDRELFSSWRPKVRSHSIELVVTSGRDGGTLSAAREVNGRDGTGPRDEATRGCCSATMSATPIGLHEGRRPLRLDDSRPPYAESVLGSSMS